MAERTEDLLSVRDGEPLDAVTRNRIQADSDARDELRRLAEMRDSLQSLPPLDPPERAWRRLNAELAGARTRRTRLWMRAAAVAAATVLIVIAAANLDRRAETVEPPPTVFMPDLPGESVPLSAAGPDYRDLVAESVRLERILTSLPEPHHLMQAGTASTIVGLEDGIAAIDARLSIGAASGLDEAYRQALWQERVDLMNALVHVRYAHAQRFVF